jgi:hypothetical protein
MKTAAYLMQTQGIEPQWLLYKFLGHVREGDGALCTMSTSYPALFLPISESNKEMNSM